MHYSTAKEKLLESGYLPLPIYPNAKNPAIQNWASSTYSPPSGFGNYGVGIVCGRGEYPIAGVDVDITDEAISKKITDYILNVAGETIYRIGKAPKTLLVYRFGSALRKKTSKRYKIGRIEILGEGQQFVSFGTHPETKSPYTWPSFLGDITEVKANELPVIDEKIIKDIFATFEAMVEKEGYAPIEKEKVNSDDFDATDPLDQQKPIGLTLDQCQQILEKIDPDCGRDQWRNVGMSLHHEFNGDEDALVLWDTWSAAGSKYKKGEPERQWQSFGKYLGRPVTAAYLIKLSKTEAEVNEDFFKSLNWSTKRFLSSPPPLPMLVDNFLPLGIVSLFYSAGGAGKSTLVLYLAVKIALANKYEVDFLGHKVNPGKVVILTAEDPDLVLNRRFIGIVQGVADELGLELSETRAVIDEYLSIVSTFGHAVSLFKVSNDGVLKTTQYYDSLLAALQEIQGLQFVVVDTKTRFSPGEGLGNVTATQEITHYEAISQQLGASVMLLHHSNKTSRDGSQTGAQAYRDATAIFDSVRAAWYLRALRQDELAAQGVKEDENLGYLLLENSKNNYIKCCPDSVITREGYKYTCKPMSKKLTKIEKEEKKIFDTRAGFAEYLMNSSKNTINNFEVLNWAASRGVARIRITELIKKMLLDGELEEDKIGRGVAEYRITDKGRAIVIPTLE